MSLNINHNLFSILVQRNLDRVSQKLDKSYSNLSSGERINCSADDPSGMATSEGLRYQVQGLRQNQKNVSGAFNLLGTAESQIDTLVNVGQRIRELVVQGANATLNSNDRQTIQTELNQLLDEMDRVASTAKFNDQYLLNGQLQGVTVQIGTTSSETLSVSLPDYRVSTLGAWAEKISDQSVGTSPLTAGAVQIAGVAVPASQYDGVSTANASASAIAKAKAINDIETMTGVHATAQPNTVSGNGPIQPVNIDGTTNVLKINGYNIFPANITAGNSGTGLVDLINTRTAYTGVTASLDGSGALQLTAEDGRNIEIVTQGSIGDELGLRAGDGDVNMVASGKVQLTSNRSFSLSDPSGLIGMSPGTQQIDPNPATAIQGISVSDTDAAARALQTIDAALAQLSDGRSTLGALNNRLEALNDTLARQIEDITKTDSGIRDTDFAYESAQYSQNQIIQEAAISMLTQANTAPRRALELLQGS